jgi:hypothetical protein
VHEPQMQRNSFAGVAADGVEADTGGADAGLAIWPSVRTEH